MTITCDIIRSLGPSPCTLPVRTVTGGDGGRAGTTNPFSPSERGEGSGRGMRGHRHATMDMPRTHPLKHITLSFPPLSQLNDDRS